MTWLSCTQLKYPDIEGPFYGSQYRTLSHSHDLVALSTVHADALSFIHGFPSRLGFLSRLGLLCSVTVGAISFFFWTCQSWISMLWISTLFTTPCRALLRKYSAADWLLWSHWVTFLLESLFSELKISSSSFLHVGLTDRLWRLVDVSTDWNGQEIYALLLSGFCCMSSYCWQPYTNICQYTWWISGG